MSQEVYNYVVLSSSTTNLILNKTNNCTFQIQWQNVIPSKYSNNKLLMRMRFSSQIAVATTDALIVYANFGNTYVFDNNSTAQSSIIGIVNPIGCNATTTTAQAYYSCGYYDNPPVLMNYPDSQQLSITFNGISNIITSVNPASNPNIWVLILSFEILK